MLIGLALTGVKPQQDVQPQYISAAANNGFVENFDDEQQQQQPQQQPFQSFQPPQQTFVEDDTGNNNIDDFVASVPAPSPTQAPFFVDQGNANFPSTPVFINDFGQPFPANQFFVDQNGQLFAPAVQTTPAFAPVLFQDPAAVPAVQILDNDAVNFPVPPPPPSQQGAAPLDTAEFESAVQPESAAAPETPAADALPEEPVAEVGVVTPAPDSEGSTPASEVDSVTAESRQQECYIRSCDQAITGRNLDYDRALQIVQKEEYLAAADLSVIRRLKRNLWSGSQDGARTHDDDLILSPVHHSIAKRSFNYCFNQSSNTTMCIPAGSGALTAGLFALIFGGAKLMGVFNSRNRAPPPPPVTIQTFFCFKINPVSILGYICPRHS